MKFGIVVFPGSNCDRDCLYALEVLGAEALFLWHGDADLRGADCIILPGGFSYGDYLRSGAMAALSPVMEAVRDHAAAGGPVLGICNGFQILCEAGLLPGALRRNESGRFCCETVALKVENYDTIFTRAIPKGKLIHLPIAHGEGNYYADSATLSQMSQQQQILFRYAQNPNGSIENIAGVTNARGNVLGLMPHPERAVEDLLGSRDGIHLFQSLVEEVARR